MATCPQGVPQELCSAAENFMANSGVTPQPPGQWDAGNVATTLLDWYKGMQRGPSQVPPIPTTLAGLLSDPFFANLLASSTNYWSGLAYKNPGIAGKINPQAWTFPWQYVSPQATDWRQAAVTAIGNMANDPNALQQLLKGVIPSFNPSQTNWSQFAASPLANDVGNFGATADNLAKAQPAIQQFLSLANSCGLFQKKTPAEVQKAMEDYLAFGVDPCTALKPIPEPPPVVVVVDPKDTGPAPPPTAAKESSALPIVVAAVGAGLAGVFIYMLAMKHKSQEASLATESNPTRREPTRFGHGPYTVHAYYNSYDLDDRLNRIVGLIDTGHGTDFRTGKRDASWNFPTLSAANAAATRLRNARIKSVQVKVGTPKYY